MSRIARPQGLKARSDFSQVTRPLKGRSSTAKRAFVMFPATLRACPKKEFMKTEANRA
jgi:hypothetical protein